MLQQTEIQVSCSRDRKDSTDEFLVLLMASLAKEQLHRQFKSICRTASKRLPRTISALARPLVSSAALRGTNGMRHARLCDAKNARDMQRNVAMRSYAVRASGDNHTRACHVRKVRNVRSIYFPVVRVSPRPSDGPTACPPDRLAA